MFFRCDPKFSTAAYENKSPLETAIEKNQMDIWQIMRDCVDLSENEKLEQLRAMIVAAKMEVDNPCKEFRDLLSSLPIESVCRPLSYFETELTPKSRLAFLEQFNQVSTKCIESKENGEKQKTLLQVGWIEFQLAKLTFLQEPDLY